jgi:hypothetical protein
METFATFDGLLKAFWIIAGASSLVFIIQTILTFIGLGTDSDFDTGVEGLDDGGFNGVFSFRNLINFFLGYGWTGVVLYEDVNSKGLLQAFAIGVGVLFVIAFLLLFKQMMKLSHDGTFQLKETVGIIADVYLRVPAGRKGKGKVQLSVRGSVHEIDAVTDDSEEIPTGGNAKVIEIIGDDVVLVSKTF